MTKWRLLAAAIAVIIVCNQSNTEAAELSVQVAIDGVDGPAVPLVYDPDARGPGEGAYIFEGYSWQYSTTNGLEGRIDLSGFLDQDPTILFAGAVVDFGSPSNFSFTFIMPLLPTVQNPSIAFDNMSGSVTDGGNNGVTLTPNPPPVVPVVIPTDSDGVPEIEVFTLSSDGGASYQNVGLDLGPAATFPNGANSAVYGPFSEGPIPAGGPWNVMRADINFRLSGGGDAFTFNGRKDLVPVPEPGTLLLGIFALFGACGVAGRRCR